MKPVSKWSSRMIFFKKNLKLKFSSFSTYFSTIWTSGISGFSKKSKNTIFGLCLSFHTGRRNKNFRKFFFCPRGGKRTEFYTRVYNSSKVTAPNVKSIFGFSGFLAQTLYKSLTNLYRILPKIRKIWKSILRLALLLLTYYRYGKSSKNIKNPDFRPLFSKMCQKGLP